MYDFSIPPCGDFVSVIRNNDERISDAMVEDDSLL